MTVSQLIEQLLECNPDAAIEIRGTTDEGYQEISDIFLDNSSDELVILDI